MPSAPRVLLDGPYAAPAQRWEVRRRCCHLDITGLSRTMRSFIAEDCHDAADECRMLDARVEPDANAFMHGDACMHDIMSTAAAMGL